MNMTREDFLGFPSRVGVDERKLLDSGDHDLDEDSFAAFLQAWLYWGLLSEFMITPGQIEFNHFIEPDGTITTKQLLSCLLGWKNRLS